jgi:hypothetical protein
VFNYTSKINNSTYMLNTEPMAFDGAESFCNTYGGHLVSYGSAAEQKEVEGYFVDTLATLFPYYHIAYWIGLTSNDGLFPRFTWLDYNTPAPGGAHQASIRLIASLAHQPSPGADH